jgi:hypothetical protein
MATDSLTVFDFGSQNIRFQNKEGRVWVSLTDMAKATGKQVGHWNELKSTPAFLKELEGAIGIPIVYQCDTKEEQGTWGIEEVAIDFASWCSIKFRVWVAQQIKKLLASSKVELVKQAPLELPPVDIRVNQLAASLQYFDIEVTNPRFKQGIQDLIGDMLGLTKDIKALPDESVEVWLGVSERAEQLGYSSSTVIDHRVSLGIFVSKASLTKKREKRLCNGTQREINLYLQTDKLDETIHTFMLQKGVSKNA